MSTSTALIAAQELTRVHQAMTATRRPMKAQLLHRELQEIADRLEDVAPLVGYVSMTSYLELIEVADQMRSSWTSVQAADSGDPLSDLRSLAKKSAFDVRQIRQDIQAVATKDATNEFWREQRDEVPDQDRTPVRRRRRPARGQRPL